MLILERSDVTIVVIHVPKTAGTTLRHLLINSLRRNNRRMIVNHVERPVTDLVRGQVYSYWHIYKEVDLAHIPVRNINDYYPINHKKPIRYITLVRSPYSRIYSAYAWYKRERREETNIDGFNKFVVERLPKIVANYYQNYIRGEMPTAEYIHFIPMWMMLVDKIGELQFDYLLRQESFNNDVKSLMEDLNLPLSPFLLNGNYRQHATDSNSTNDSHLDKYTFESMRIIELLYRRDFILFGYKFLLN